jgi:6-phosphogluconolactonase
VTRLTSCPDADRVAARAAAVIERHLQRAREQRGVAHIALSGGTTPGHAFELLAASDCDWDGVEIWFADERCVSPEDEQSNFRLAAQTLLEPAAIDPASVHRMQGELGPQEGAHRYALELTERLDAEPRGGGAPAGVPVLDAVVLGIGPDGHVASLFPGAATLDAGADAVCLGVSDSPKPPPQRITLSLAVLRAARACILLATGASKADAVTAMLGEPTPQVPASLLLRERLTVIVDDAAAPTGPLR